MGTVDAGQFRRRITIQQEDRSNRTSSGGFNLGWITVPGCNRIPANITYPPPSKKGDEVYTQQQVRSSVFATITIRYRPSTNIDASMRILYGTRVFNIRTVLPVDERLQVITLQCEELQGKGSLHT